MPPEADGRWRGPENFKVPNTTINDGHGHTIVDTRGLFVLHAFLLRTGKVLMFCGHVELAYYASLCYLFDPANPSAQMSPIGFPPDADMFCCHYIQVPDGRILAMGGSELHGRTGHGFETHGSTGSRTIALFDPETETWAVSRTGGSDNKLKQGRWYPTPVLLADGRVAVFSGRREFRAGHSPSEIADMVEILAPPNWESAELSGAARALPIYPGLHLAPNGRIYYTHTNWGQEIPEPPTASIAIPSGATSATWTDHPHMPAVPRKEEGMSVLLPLMLPDYRGRILVVGGSKAVDINGNGVLDRTAPPPFPDAPLGPPRFHHIVDPGDPLRAEILDTSANPPTWSPAPGSPMGHGRINGHCVLLPDATVFVVGGHNRYKWHTRAQGTQPSLIPEIFTPPGPGAGFRPMAAMTHPRMYHSVALLLPDGRVFTAGGADENRREPLLTYPPGWEGRTYAGMALNDKGFDIYEPPYCFKGPRPVIADIRRKGESTRRIQRGEKFVVRTPQAAIIHRVALMWPGAPTHHTDSGQRYIQLEFTIEGDDELEVTAVTEPNVAPPGYYLLWIVDNEGRPCQRAPFIKLEPRLGAPGGGKSCFIATAAYGSADHAGVVYLQGLREEIRESTRFGRRFIAAVNRIYESFSPWVARYLDTHPAARAAARDVVVKPVVAVVAATDRSVRPRNPVLRHAALITLLTAEAVAGIAALPAVLAVAGVRTLLERRRNRQPERRRGRA